MNELSLLLSRTSPISLAGAIVTAYLYYRGEEFSATYPNMCLCMEQIKSNRFLLFFTFYAFQR
jgi:hypothetical protein